MKSFLEDETGQTAAEYLLIVALGVAVVVASAMLATQMKKYVEWAQTSVEYARDTLIGLIK